MGAWFDWAGLGIGAGGLVASIAGLLFAYLARRAAKSAERAAREARNSISETFCLVSAQRALTAVARLTTLHQNQDWNAALEVHRELRTLLNDISGSMPLRYEQSKAAVMQGIGQLSVIENLVRQVLDSALDPSIYPIHTVPLDTIHSALETLVRVMMPASDKEGDSNG